MRKLKIYLDTSVISYLHQEDTPERMAETLKLWRQFEAGRFDVFLSRITLEELERCPEPKRGLLYDYLNKIQYFLLEVSEETLSLAQKIVDMGILTQKSFDDCQHIAVAMVYGCDCIVSWNFKHIVNIRTIRGIRAVSDLEGYKGIEIVAPAVLLEEGENG